MKRFVTVCRGLSVVVRGLSQPPRYHLLMSQPVPQIQAHALVAKVAGALRRRCGLGSALRGAEILVAVSGGGDSVALLRALALLAPRRRWKLHLTVGHVQHHLRDDHQAEGDAEFVRDLAAQMDLPFLRRDIDLSDAKQNLEDAARQARYQVA